MLRCMANAFSLLPLYFGQEPDEAAAAAAAAASPPEDLGPEAGAVSSGVKAGERLDQLGRVVIKAYRDGRKVQVADLWARSRAVIAFFRFVCPSCLEIEKERERERERERDGEREMERERERERDS